MRGKLSAALLATVALAAETSAQPATDIFLATIEHDDGRKRIGEVRNVTDRPGYDNQPHFMADGRSFLFTSIRADGQADIYRYDLATGSTTRLTETPESEYSPTPLPGGDGFSVVRVEADSAQRLWRFDPGGTDPSLLLPGIEPVGYHAWIDTATVALFVLGPPPTLQLARIPSGEPRILAEDIGRSLHRIPGGLDLSFVQKRSEGGWAIRLLDPESGTTRTLIETLPESEDFAWTPDGTILMGKGSELYSWNPHRGGGWERVADLADAGITEITRIAVAPEGNQLALVSAR